MNKILHVLVYVLLWTSGSFFVQAQSENRQNVAATLQRDFFQKSGDIFGTRNFIENKGQFEKILPEKRDVLYLFEHGGEKAFFTAKGPVYELRKDFPLSEEEREKQERGQEVKQKASEVYLIPVSWIGGNPSPELEASDKQTHYFTYGTPEYNSSAYKTLTYKDIYPNIDLEYSIPENKDFGIKYSLILRPGSNPEQIKFLYSGAVKKLRKNSKGEIQVKTPLNDIVEHRPYSFSEDGAEVSTEFELHGDTLSFIFPNGFDRSKTLVLDPWVTLVTAFGGSNAAFDVDYDFGGNTLIYGGFGSGPWKIAKYNTSGILQWTFGGTVVTPAWTNQQISASNFGVDKFTGKSYTGQGVVNSGAQVVRIDANGNYDNFISTANGSYREIWEFGFHCLTMEVFIFGGSTAGNLSAATINSVNSSLNVTTFQPTIPSAGQDIACYAIDDQGKIFVVYGAAFTMNNKICLVNPAFNGNVWTVPSGFSSLSENGNKINFQPGVTSNGLNCLAVNGNYLFYYDGLNLAAYNKLTGANVSSITIPGTPTVKRQAGIAVDDCNRLYLGGNGSILTYSFNGTTFNTLTPIPLGVNTATQNVHDIKLDRNTKVLYVCGTGFVCTYAATLSYGCPVPPGVCLFNQAGIGASTSSITCATLGSATVSANGGLGPFSYTWIPSGITGPVASSLTPGTYTVIVHDAGYNATYTTTTTFLSPVPLTGTVSNTFMLACNGVNNGTAAVISLAGGSGNQTYLWTNGVNSQTTAVATGLGGGNYTLTVTDALTGCVFSPTFTIYEPPLFSTFISSSSPTVCAGGNINLFINSSGGVPVYTYSWVAGPASSSLQVSQNTPGTYSYTAISKDANNCTNVSTISVNFVPNPTLTVSNVSICPLETGTLSAAGASTYTWNGSSAGSTYTANPLSNTLYTVVGSAQSCTSSATASIVLKPIPNPVFSSNSPKCQGDAIQFGVNTGVNFLWAGVGNYFSNSQSNVLSVCHPAQSGVYQVTVTAANACTAATQGTLTIHPTPTLSATGSTVCVNQLMQLSANSSQASNFVWTGPNFVSLLQNPSIANPAVSVSGNYSVLVTSAQSCTNRAVANVTVTPLPIINISSNSPLCFGKTLNLNASATTGGMLFQWSGPNNFSSALQNPNISNVTVPASGNYSLMVSTGPCSVLASHMVTVHPLPMPVAFNSGPVCEGKSFQLGVNNSGVVYSWWGPNGYTSSSQQLNFSPAQLNHSGVYTVQVTDGNGCVAIAASSVTVLSNPVVHAFGDMVCFGEPAQLNASGADTYQWFGPVGYSAQGAAVQIPAAFNTQIWTYTVIGTGINGCTTMATSTVGTRPLPVASMSITPRVCVNEKVYLNGQGGVAYLWSGPLNYHSSIQNPSFMVMNTGAAGEYSLMVTDINGCRAFTRAALLVDPEPSALLKGRSSGCVPFCSDYSLEGLNSVSLQNVNWQLNNFSQTAPMINYCFTQSGNYELKASFESEQHCAGSFVQYIEVYALPEADFSYQPLRPVEYTDLVLFTSKSKGEQINQWTWSFNDGKNLDTEGPSSARLFEEAGIYVVVLQVKNKWDCLDTVIKTIEVMTDFNVYVPNAFTPNGDGLNDTFFPVMRGVKHFEMQVFDRWGSLIYATNTPEKVWDGTFKGQLCKQDIYNYKMVLLNNKGEEKQYNGTVMLYR